MDDFSALLRALPLEVFETPKSDDAWARCPLAAASDAILVHSVAAAISPPKVQISSSFLLHAPLELLARTWLLSRVARSRRDQARRRIAEIGARYATEGREIESEPKEYSDSRTALSELEEALRAGDAEVLDRAVLFLAPRISFERFRATLADRILPLLGAAGHAPILLMMLNDPAVRFPGSNKLLRSPLRALALEANRRLTWMEAPEQAEQRCVPSLFDALAAPEPRAASSTSIAPTMLAVERDGYAARLLGAATTDMSALTARRILLRVAALSMLLDDPVHAPYGWTHCFTLPQAILSLEDVASDVTRAIRLAATYVLGFRATLGRVPLKYSYVSKPRVPSTSHHQAPADSAAAVFNAGTEQHESIRARLIERAAAHADGHLVKYTMACLVAADQDPQESSLYLAAAAYLGGWWDSQSP